jgi:hypothetical protein
MYVINTAPSAAPSDATVPEVAGIEPRTVATLALIVVVTRSNHSAIDVKISLFQGMIPETPDVSQSTNGEYTRGETTRVTTGTRKGITTSILLDSLPELVPWNRLLGS